MNSFDTTLEDPSCASPVEVRFFARRRDEGGVGAMPFLTRRMSMISVSGVSKVAHCARAYEC